MWHVPHKKAYGLYQSIDMGTRAIHQQLSLRFVAKKDAKKILEQHIHQDCGDIHDECCSCDHVIETCSIRWDLTLLRVSFLEP